MDTGDVPAAIGVPTMLNEPTAWSMLNMEIALPPRLVVYANLPDGSTVTAYGVVPGDTENLVP